jgi:HPt (histidine-containing phosphotransfer) domain-containing protein
MKTDLSYLRELAGGNKELALDMINIFKSQVVEFAQDMENHLNNKEYDLLGKLAHKAKSSVAIMGLDELATMLKDLENDAREGKNIERYPSMVDHFKKETTEVIKELQIVTDNIDFYF